MEIEHAIHQAVCRTMPTAAKASGFLSTVTGLYTVDIARLSAKFPYATRTEELGLSRLRTWLAMQGEVLPEGLLKAVQKAWLRDGRVEGSRVAGSACGEYECPCHERDGRVEGSRVVGDVL